MGKLIYNDMIRNFSLYINERVKYDNELLNKIKAGVKETKFYFDYEDKDFVLRYDFIGKEENLNLDWIYIKTKTYSGTEIFKCLIEIAKENGVKSIKAYSIKGVDFIKAEGKSKKIETNGYYTMLRWGFIPDGGINFLNGILGTDYRRIEDAYKDPEFWAKWRKDGIEFVGFFYLTENSISFKILNKEI